MVDQPKKTGAKKKVPKKPVNIPKQNEPKHDSNVENVSNTPKQPIFSSIPSKHGPAKLIINTNDTTEMLQPIPTQVVQENLDEVLTAVRQCDRTCDFAKCKTKTSLMFQDCDMCRQRFCFKHGLPEVHGCGEAVKRVEREQFLRPVPHKTLRQEAELKEARKKMEQKLKDMNLARKAKPATGSKSKK